MHDLSVVSLEIDGKHVGRTTCDFERSNEGVIINITNKGKRTKYMLVFDPLHSKFAEEIAATVR